MTILYQNIINAFQPAKEISDPSRFSGRKQQIERGVELLLGGNHIFIHGNRGIGKSSLARQLALIASGNNELLESIGSKLSNSKLDYVTCFLARDSSVNNINQLIYRLLIDSQALAHWNELLGLEELGTYELGEELNPKLVSDFWNRLGKYSELAGSGVAIFIDEFELIKNQNGFASLIKANPCKCIFVITGIGQTEKDLVRDHESIGRQLDTGKLEVPNMSESELRLIIEKAQEYISNEIIFENEAIKHLVKIVKGHPYLLHLIGNNALMHAFKNKKSIVTRETLDLSLQDIATNRADRQLEERYLKAIGNSSQREAVLRIFSGLDQEVVHTSIAYPAAEKQSISNPSYWVADLQKDQFGSELEKVADQYYKISDPLFRAYVFATPPRLNTSTEENQKQHLKADNEFIIIQISDIHFGSSHYFTNLSLASDSIPECDKPSLSKYIVESIKSYQNPGNFLAVTGDITQRALTEEFEDAEVCIEEIISNLKNSEIFKNRNFSIVPGNHDVNWEIQKADPKARYLGFSQYIRFLSKFGKIIDNQILPERLYEITDLINDFNCIIVGFNSAVLEGPDDHRGYIGESQFKNAIKEVNEICNGRKVIKIALLHHHINPVSTLESSLKLTDETLKDAAFIKQGLLEEGFLLALHGHRHFSHEEAISQNDADSNKLLIVGCGSTAVVNQERGSHLLQYNRIAIRRIEDKNVTTITINKIFFDPHRRKWMASEDHKPKNFIFPYI